jgi:hypothetical protein
VDVPAQPARIVTFGARVGANMRLCRRLNEPEAINDRSRKSFVL